jgi:hypothetical protein
MYVSKDKKEGFVAGHSIHGLILFTGFIHGLYDPILTYNTQRYTGAPFMKVKAILEIWEQLEIRGELPLRLAKIVQSICSKARGPHVKYCCCFPYRYF